VRKLKTFKDLRFKPHLSGDGLMAQLNFANGYGVSVVRFKIGGDLGSLAARLFADNPIYSSYTSNEKEWELAVLRGESICYSTPITDDVIGHLSARQVTAIMKRVQAL
jgi:hypothetical protein